MTRYIVTDPGICHGQPTFRGTRIMIWQILEQVSSDMAWESITEAWEVGLYLFCVIIQFPDGKGFPVTARPMTRKEQRRFNQWSKR